MNLPCVATQRVASLWPVSVCVRCRAHAMPDEKHAGEAIASLAEGDRYYRAEVHLSQGGQDYCIMGWSREQITHDVLNHYGSHLEFLKGLR